LASGVGDRGAKRHGASVTGTPYVPPMTGPPRWLPGARWSCGPAPWRVRSYR